MGTETPKMIKAAFKRFLPSIYGFLRVSDLILFRHITNFLGMNRDNDSLRWSVLLATGVAGEISATRFDRYLATRFKMIGCSVSLIICNGGLSACQFMRNKNHETDEFDVQHRESGDLCKRCVTGVASVFGDCKVYWLERTNCSYDRPSEIEKRGLFYRGIDVAQHAYAGTVRYFAVGQLEGTEFEQDIFNRYLISSKKYVDFLHAHFKKNRVDIVYVNHGIYVPHGILVDFCKLMNIPVVTWNLGYRRGTILFGFGDTYHRYYPGKNSGWEYAKLNAKQHNLITNYLESKYNGESDWVSFQPKDAIRIDVIKYLKIDNKKYRRIISLFSNVAWDAQIHFSENVFESMFMWVFKTIDYAKNNPDVLFLLRVHPAESKGRIPSAQPLNEVIKKRFDQIPPNFLMFDQDSKVSSYDCAAASDLTVVYATKLAMELASFGKPVCVVGDAWVRGKGFTLDPNNEQEYFSILSMDKAEYEAFAHNVRILALSYAYWFYFEACIEFPDLKFKKGFPPFNIDSFATDDQSATGFIELVHRSEKLIENEHPIF